MDTEQEDAYVFQPMPPQDDGRFYGVAVPWIDDGTVEGLTKEDAGRVASHCNSYPDTAKTALKEVRYKVAADWKTECGCRFESLFSNAVMLCEECSKHPAHNR